MHGRLTSVDVKFNQIKIRCPEDKVYSVNFNMARTYLLSKPESIMDYPFGPDVAVMKVKGKMFATLGTEDGEGRMNLKCDPHEALMLRDLFKSVLPGYHMNKKHWNTIHLDGSIPVGEIERMIDNSYGLVVNSLTKPLKSELLTKYGPEQLGIEMR